MNMFKKNGGFTLVELIVVIAILAILAGIAVPAYSGYIKKAEQAADVQMLSPIATAAQGLAIEQKVTVSKIVVTVNAAKEVDLVAYDASNAVIAGITETEVTGMTGPLKFSGALTATWTATAGKWDLG